MRLSKENALFRGLAVMALAAPLLAGCNDSSPTEPKLAATATPTVIWSNSVQLVSVSGNCFDGIVGQVGQVYQTTFELRRTGDSVVFVPQNIDNPMYTATVSGVSFTATSSSQEALGPPCGHSHFTGSLSGRFSEDSSHLTATEVLTYTFDSGQVAATTFSWSASRR